MASSELTPAEKVRTSFTNVTHEPKIAGCVDCEEKAPIRAVILSPNLGTPLILPPGQNKCSIFIAAEPLANQYFGVGFDAPLRPTEYFGNKVLNTKYGAVFVDRHLRLYPIKGKQTAKETKDTMLFADGKAAPLAMAAVRVWQVGAFRGGMMVNHSGEPVAIIRPATVKMYSGLSHIYEIEIDLSKLPGGASLSTMCTFAWMVPVPQKYVQRPELKGVEMWEYQDQVILDFLDAQKTNPQRSHYPNLYEFDLKAPLSATALPRQTPETTHRLMAWHPIIRSKATALKIGHLSDVHVNARQNALAKSPAHLLELPGGAPAPETPAKPPASNLCNSFIALHGLVERFGKGDSDTPKADALVITGDLLDFNRNLDPAAVPADNIGEQWKAFNVLNKIGDGALYKRGLDDMLVYSLLRHAYRELNLPVFLTTGNHEAYQIPYGISPRQNPWVLAAGVLEDEGAFGKAPHGLRPVNLGAAGLASAATKYKLLAAIGKDAYLTRSPADVYADADRASEFVEAKANDGIAADHNLTIYEACLAYGPTYPQVLTAKNYDAGYYDWFFILFTPLSDWRHVYGTQYMLGLDWGPEEEYVNLSGTMPLRADKQGAGILPRAKQAISDAQRALLNRTQYLAKSKYHGQMLLFSHFTFVNYDTKVAFSDRDRMFVPANALGDCTKAGENSGGWNFNNMGTCERNLAWFFQNCANQRKTGGVDVHFSGHSHRAGVYTTSQSEQGSVVHVVGAFDPGLQPNDKANAIEPGVTKFVVSSCGGPIGVQNLNHELGGWTLTPPSGTLYDSTAKSPFRQITYTKGSAQPRLAVALDYMEISDAERVLQWEPAKGSTIFLVVGPKTQKLECIVAIRLWGFKKNTLQNDSGTWMPFDTTLKFRHLAGGSAHESPVAAPQSGVYEMALPAAKLADVKELQDAKTTRWFCEVKLKAPKGFPANHFKLDSWFFPVEFRIRKTGYGPMPVLRRRLGEQGEVPDWDWLSKTLGETRYPVANSVTGVDTQ
ncbi:metallophosphoesterase [Cupriavidus sp. UME77]|uniref:metallophosphoesterase n=1 Tax=Cupriavidus sp. UME77 TaxID=1862321 RepID=UPI0016043FDE|nr:metallophosphoesterase [Cupriavidus sp. UME77]MBB1633635.1 hypothetical protein [Cupriavidus sp. UME77]